MSRLEPRPETTRVYPKEGFIFLSAYGEEKYYESHREILLSGYGREACVDAGIADDILLLWREEIDTFASCEGGGDGDRYIAIRGTVEDAARAAFLVPNTRISYPNGIFYDPQHWKKMICEPVFIR